MALENLSGTALLVLGMHRSGTSATAGMLKNLGVELGSQLIPAQDHNPKGFFEHIGIVSLHNELLAVFGSEWSDPLPLPPEWERDPRVTPFQNRIFGIIKRDFAGKALWGLKDPRLCRLLPLWRPILKKLNIAAKVVLVVRHPGEVATSLSKRDQMSAEQALMLWLSHVLLSERHSRDLRRTVIIYEDLVRDWQMEADRLRTGLDIDLFSHSLGVTETVDDFIDVDLRHNIGVPLPPIRADQNRWAEKVYNAIVAWQRHGTSPHEVCDEASGALAYAANSAIPIVKYLYTKNSATLQVCESKLRGELSQRGQRVDQLADQLRQAGVEAEGLRQRVRALEMRSVELQRELSAQETEADRLGRVAAARSTEADRLRREVAALELRRISMQGEMDQRGQRVDELAGLLRGSVAETEGLQQRFAGLSSHCEEVELQRTEAARLVEALHASRSWRITAPLRGVGLGLRKVKRGGYVGAALVSRGAYHTLPLPVHFKLRLKHGLFARTGSTFATTGAYARWQETVRQQAAAGEAGRSAIALPSAELPSPPVEVPSLRRTLEVLPVADGHWEWQGYAEMRERIAEVLATRRAALNYRPRPMIELGEEDPAEAAARIALKPPGLAPEVSVIVPVFNELASTIECLLSLAATAGDVTFEVIVANDASTDHTREVLSRVPNLRLVNQPENLGFLRNCNMAAKDARGRRLVLLNNDTQVEPAWLVGLMRALDQPGVGAAGARFVFPSGVLQEAGVRILREGAVEMIGFGDLPESPRWSYCRDVDYVSGACLMLDKELFHELGGFAEDLAPAYCEDVDLCLRIRGRGLRIVYTPEAEIVHHLNKSSDALGIHYKHGLITRNMQRLSERHQATLDALDDLRVLAFYLPQFHPVPENDLWWGPGFTEWTNVSKARPNFVGHDQPRLPSDLGYYDLRLPEVMQAQWDLAARYGIDGFCYYYYWFDGHRLLDRPLDRLLDPAATAYPFCLCWANENWTRRWDGQDQEILMAQRHSPKDDLGVIRDLVRYMRNPAYIQVRGKPLLLVYRTDLFPAFAQTAQRWREECRRLDLGEIYLVMVESFRFSGASVSPSSYGCDASVEFPAHYMPDVRPPEGAILNPEFRGNVADFRDAALRFATREHSGFTRFRTVMPGWDNTARLQNTGFILDNPTPGVFQAWMETAIAETKRDLQGDERLLFVNAWNEWAEGAYLEPDCRFGHTFLEAVRNARDAAHLLSGGDV